MLPLARMTPEVLEELQQLACAAMLMRSIHPLPEHPTPAELHIEEWLLGVMQRAAEAKAAYRERQLRTIIGDLSPDEAPEAYVRPYEVQP